MPLINEIIAPKLLNFKSYFKKKRGTRQQRGWTGQTRQHQNLVPFMHKKDPSKNSKVEQLRTGEPVKKVLTPQDLGFITTKYGIKNVDKEHPRQLGKTGIHLYYDISVGAWCLKK